MLIQEADLTFLRPGGLSAAQCGMMFIVIMHMRICIRIRLFDIRSASAIEARDELRRRVLKPHLSRFSSSPSEVVSIED